MATWKSRFEDIVAEVNGKMTPSEIRTAYLNRTLGSQLYEELQQLKTAYELGDIDQDDYYRQLDELQEKLRVAREHINKVNFNEDI